MNNEELQKINRLIQTELKLHNIPLSDFDNVLAVVADFDKKHKGLKEQNHRIYYILLLALAYKAGRESVVT